MRAMFILPFMLVFSAFAIDGRNIAPPISAELRINCLLEIFTFFMFKNYYSFWGLVKRIYSLCTDKISPLPTLILADALHLILEERIR